MFACPCCGYFTLEDSGGFCLCPVCYWEDDGQGDHDANVVRGGPNGSLSLTDARANYAAFGASMPDRAAYVRPPRHDEMPPTRPTE